MKTILALALSALFVGSAFAQERSTPLDSASGTRHMFEFNADSILQGVISLNKSKRRGEAADNDTAFALNVGYAYQLPMLPQLQIGGRVRYDKLVGAEGGDQENYGADVGVILNHTDDLTRAYYASLYAGMLWNNQYGSGRTDDEVRRLTLAVGKRFNLEDWGIKHLTYTPEIALQNRNSTTGGDFEYVQDIQFRVLQFSVFF